jgi:hypothetical protein
MMRLTVMLLSTVILAGPAAAQSFGEFGVLTTSHPDRMSLGAVFSGDGGSLVSTFELRGDLARGGSVGAQASVDDRVFGAQLDFRRGLVNTGGNLSLDLGGQVAGGFTTGRGVSGVFVQVVPGVSREWEVSGRQTLGLWTGLGLRLSTRTGESGAADGLFRLGGRFGFSSEMGLLADFEDAGGSDHLMVGIDYRFGPGGMRSLPRSR